MGGSCLLIVPCQLWRWGTVAVSVEVASKVGSIPDATLKAPSVCKQSPAILWDGSPFACLYEDTNLQVNGPGCFP